jgi:DNA repair exonuclease SbcCD nuclease subunit
MALSLIHTSDWHIGKPFGRLDEGVAAILRHARLKACDRLAEAARSCGAGIVLVAGDLFDRPSLADRELRAPLEQMNVYRDLVWHIIPGNHDPAVAGGIWDRVRRIGLPGNVVLHLESKPVEIAAGVWLLPSPLAAKSMSVDPTAWMDTAVTPAGALRIGLAHGSIQGFGSEHRASIEIAPDRPKLAGLSYLALGDWHGVREIGSRAAYCGTPEPDGFLDNSPGFALQVSFDGAEALPRIVRREIGEHRWLKRVVDGGRSSDIAGLEAEIEGLGALAKLALLAVEVTGRVTMTEESDVRECLDRLDGRVLHLERQFDRMVPAPVVDDVEQLPEGHLRDLAGELAALAVDPADERRAVAGRALRYLFELSEPVPAQQPGDVA